VGNSNEITVTYVHSRQSELVGVGYVDGDGLLNVLQEVSEYPDRQVACGKAIIVSEIGEYRKQLDLIIASELENTRADIKGQLGSIDDACKEQNCIPIYLNLEVRDVTLMLVIPTEDVVLYQTRLEQVLNHVMRFNAFR